MTIRCRTSAALGCGTEDEKSSFVQANEVSERPTSYSLWDLD